MSLRIRRPDDWHVHWRSGKVLEAVLPFTMQHFGRALVMPNIVPPVTTVAAAEAYAQEIRRAMAGVARTDAQRRFHPWLTLYLTDRTTAETIRAAQASGLVLAAKWYPAGATTHSDAGVTRVEHLYPALEEMQRLDMVLCVHGEVTDAEVDVFDRERVFVQRVLQPLRHRYPQLRIVLEHVTTAYAAEWVRSERSGRLGATLTAHHLLCNRNALFAGGLRPHCYCLPVLKRESDRQALLEAIRHDDRGQFFLGTDSAPHRRSRKESECCSAGCFTAPAAVSLYAQAFADAGMLERLEAFASVNGARFYQVDLNEDVVELRPEPWTVPPSVPVIGMGIEADDDIRPFWSGQTLSWRYAETTPKACR
ncbi:hypothetical protein CDCA_CDCA03G0843 [Cyanidium caldarium]|uniref:dihydroorotase n=1 Tax=Cyanidium caldarium TaxID=2771 RepID=A0AAV9IRY9_CYACA|nr:hypothetical protein CDCA_CDCA03G0843 [Cyanidium caldarium]